MKPKVPCPKCFLGQCTGDCEKPMTPEQYVQEAIESFIKDPPDSAFQRGYLEALLVVWTEAFNKPPYPQLVQDLTVHYS